MESRSLPVPDGLAGERVDAGLSKLLGFSRTFAADVAEAGGVRIDGSVAQKSDRLAAGTWIEIEWQPREPLSVVATPVNDLTVVYQDDDLVVIDKPVGVAAHPSVGWDGPTVLGALAAAGIR
ncbi:MAG TPA: S4 domain-containing protein, partial [Galbitalea sp.]|nr:S4 domain-containing protein [Galbitalea sp.]